MIKFKYFFGTDKRSVGFLNTVYNQNNNVKVVTLPPVQTGRGRKYTPNPVQTFCEYNNISFIYYDDNAIYNDMEYGIVASFSKIFTDKFLTTNSDLFNIHLSLLPKYKGPTPVETAILNLNNESGYTVFKINNDVDTGDIIFQKTLNIHNKYATEIYEEVNQSFNKEYKDIDFYKEGYIQDNLLSNTQKYYKDDFDINNLTIEDAKTKIRAFDYLGPAYLKYHKINLKILNYSEKEVGSSIELRNGMLYPLYVIPEGKRKMLFEDYIRGIK